MKVNEICKVGFSRLVFNDVIDCRGFVKTPPYNMLAGKPLINAQTACSSVSGQGRVKDIQKSRSLGVQPL